MDWLALILPLIEMILKWLSNKNNNPESLRPTQRKKFENLLSKMETILNKSKAKGFNPN